MAEAAVKVWNCPDCAGFLHETRLEAAVKEATRTAAEIGSKKILTLPIYNR